MARIFISYRRDDAGGYAGRMFDRLSEYFGTGQVFMDTAAIEPGADFVAEIRRRLSDCDVLVAVIGRQWLRPELDESKNYVVLEIRTALQEGVRVIPALVGVLV